MHEYQKFIALHTVSLISGRLFLLGGRFCSELLYLYIWFKYTIKVVGYEQLVYNAYSYHCPPVD